MANKEPEWQKQEKLRAERRSHKKRHGKIGPRPGHGAQDMSMAVLILEVKGSGADARRIAYNDLVDSASLRTYFPEMCNRSEERKRSVSLGRMELEGPKAILQKIEHELRAGWQRGPLVPKWRQGEVSA